MLILAIYAVMTVYLCVFVPTQHHASWVETAVGEMFLY